MVLVVLATAGVFVGLFTVFGPIGTYVTFTPLQRIAYVGVLAAIGTPVYYCVMVVTLYYMRYRSPLACTLAVVAGVALCAIPATATSYVLHVVAYPDAPIPDLGALYLSSFAGAVSASLLFTYMVFQRKPGVRDSREPVTAGDRTDRTDAIAVVDALPAAAHEAPPPARTSGGEPNGSRTATQQVSFLRRLPQDARGQIIFLKTESHYVRVHTTAGTSRLLLRFADAVDELAGVGMQVHRSYWVSHDQVLAVLKRNNRTVLRVTGNHEVPVSRTYVSSVHARHSSC